jgi:hypothetical protein
MSDMAMDAMTRFVLDPSLRSRLPDLESPVEFCDEAGKPLGVFIPNTERERLLYEWARAAFSDAELAAARSEPDGCGIDEVLARLGG